jgi:DNA-binding NarL/FixJ family response regulator
MNQTKEDPARIRVLIADDQPLVRAGLKMLLSTAPDIQVVGEATGGEEAVRLVRELTADVVLMDIRMHGVDGLEAMRRISADEDLAGVRVVILTTFDIDDYVFEALHAGASGFLLKDAEPDELIRAVRVAAAGDALLSPSVTRRLIADYSRRPRPRLISKGLDVLTDREREVMALVARGLSNEEIAARLVVSPLTAKTHVSRILAKLGARDRAQLVMLAYEHGLVQPGEISPAGETA